MALQKNQALIASSYLVQKTTNNIKTVGMTLLPNGSYAKSITFPYAAYRALDATKHNIIVPLHTANVNNTMNITIPEYDNVYRISGKIYNSGTARIDQSISLIEEVLTLNSSRLTVTTKKMTALGNIKITVPANTSMDYTLVWVPELHANDYYYQVIYTPCYDYAATPTVTERLFNIEDGSAASGQIYSTSIYTQQIVTMLP